MALTKQRKPIFIVGEGRSGTTLLRKIISEHPSIWGVEKESYIFVTNWPQANPYLEAYKHDFEKLLMTVLVSMKRVPRQAKKLLSKNILDEDIQNDLDAFKESKQYQDLKSQVQFDRYQIYDSLCEFFLERKGASRVVEKTPYHLYYVEELLSRYPDAQFIAIYRDPRAVSLSWIKKDPLKSIMGTCFSWNRAMRQIKYLQEKLPAESFKVIRYEDLITEPRTTLENLTTWLSEDFHENLLKEQSSNASFDDQRGQKGFFKGAIDRWKKSLSQRQIAFVNSMTNKHHKDFAIENYQSDVSFIENLAMPFFYIAAVLKLVTVKFLKLVTN